jgi:hypothetical protein
MMVVTTLSESSLSSFIFNGFSDKITKSATLPTVIEPFVSWILACQAALIVMPFKA